MNLNLVGFLKLWIWLSYFLGWFGGSNCVVIFVLLSLLVKGTWLLVIIINNEFIFWGSIQGTFLLFYFGMNLPQGIKPLHGELFVPYETTKCRVWGLWPNKLFNYHGMEFIDFFRSLCDRGLWWVLMFWGVFFLVVSFQMSWGQWKMLLNLY